MARYVVRGSKEWKKTKLAHNEVNAIRQDKNLFRRPMQVLSERAVDIARISLCTNQVVDTEIVRQYGIGIKGCSSKSHGIVVIADELRQCLETEAWVPATVLKGLLTARE
ncbi:hypothetical protein BDV30DRAFT_211831 [Aspergillus minisclerotigenes]|uniref:Uncharacterized protein n=1 Tax=Aspergillus minisclerotigenes TaxID=656917 RepID=A0A5N6J0U3_9EURO|nr:hypothetical protein BDV30DRAFT_211831 [Aspergillus minisclerotigenes]